MEASAKMVLMKNSVHVEFTSDAEDFVQQCFCIDFFVMEILQGVFKIKPAGIFCLQDFVACFFFGFNLLFPERLHWFF